MLRISSFGIDLFNNAQQLVYQPAARRTATYVASSVGFTIVELLIVIVVIGILAAMVIVAFNGISSSANDAHRKADISNVQKFLEVYHAKHGHYVKSDHFLNANASAAISSGGVLEGLSPESLKGPNTSGAMVSSFVQWAGSMSETNEYSIKTFTSSNDNCIGSMLNDSDCTRYELRYRKANGTTELIYSAAR